MSTQIQRRRGTTAEHSTFTGVEGELTIDTTKDTAVVHDGTTVGGHPLQKQYPALGSASTPTYTFTGDTNTGIYSPGADQLAISTNGTGRLFIDASGNVGFGQASPTSIASYTILSVNNTAGGAAYFQSSNTLKGRIINTTTEFYIGGASGTPLILEAGGSEKLRITSAGLVGVGVSSPQAALHTAGNSYNSGSNPLIGAYATNSSAQFALGNGSYANHWLIYQTVDGLGNRGPLNIYDAVAAASRVTIDTSGRVAIGSTNPQSLLHLETDGTALRIVRGSSVGFLYNTGTASTATTRLQGNDGPVEIYTNATQPVLLSPGGSEKVRCDPSGRVLVGTSSARSNFVLGTPTVQFETATSTFNQGLSIINNGGTAGYDPTLTLGATRGTSVGSNTAIPSAGYGLGRIDFAGADGTTLLTGARIHGVSDGVWGTNDGPSALVFSTTADGASSPTERMRITQAGKVLLNATSTTYAAPTFATRGEIEQTIATYNNGDVFVRFVSGTQGSGTLRGYIETNGVSVLYSTASDVRLKENIQNAQDAGALLDSINVRSFDWKESGIHQDFGFVAQELSQVYPQAVSVPTEEDRPLAVDYSQLVPLLVKEIQSLRTRLAALEAQ